MMKRNSISINGLNELTLVANGVDSDQKAALI